MNLLRSLSFHLLSEPKFGRSKRIKIWANGESQCYEFNINPRNYRSWTAVLLDVTNVIKPNFGAVRKLIALSTMQVVDCFEDLDPKEKYIALGVKCKFKTIPGGYRTNNEKDVQRKKVAKLYTGDINTKTETFLIETKRKNLTIVYMVVNGRSSQIPEKVVFNEKDMKNWDVIHKYLTNILDIPEGISKICTIFGQELKKPTEFQHGFLYVAVPFQETFVMLDYANCLEKQNKHRGSYTMAIRPANNENKTASVKRNPSVTASLKYSENKDANAN
ncbi:unnamed protein product [Phyllotreta striolata]|uniref:Doublecortin domain-containing protein n=1 Tax=Phyllotreta striolata TaxID=444603 RepID=A0A9N9TT31_PHYSR|nr:unnamed protein product [Phyllotreta striolata]